jgi:hypothetical protein
MVHATGRRIDLREEEDFIDDLAAPSTTIQLGSNWIEQNPAEGTVNASFCEQKTKGAGITNDIWAWILFEK